MTMKTTLRAFHNDPSIKDSLLARLRDDAAHGRIVERQDWEDREGCAVGGSDHMLYESEYGIPAVLAHIEDTIHEGSPGIGSGNLSDSIHRSDSGRRRSLTHIVGVPSYDPHRPGYQSWNHT